MTIEVNWVVPESTALAEAGFPLDLELTDGRVVDAVAWPEATSGGPEQQPDGGWRLGSRRSGQIRARIETSAGGSLRFRAGGQVIHMPVALVLEGPQRTPPQAPIDIEVKRLSWDAISVSLTDGEGIVTPGAKVPIHVGFNVVTPEPVDLALRCVAELRPARGGEPVWRDEIRQAISSNQSDAPRRVWEVVAPRAEGTYVLEIRANWEPAPSSGRDGLLIARLVRRRRSPGASGSAVRRVSLTVLGSGQAHDGGKVPGRPAQVVDNIDLARPRKNRLVTSGRSPLAPAGHPGWSIPETALVEPKLRDRLRGWVTGTGAANLAAADPAGLTWSAIGLKVAHADRPHRLVVTVAGGHPSALGVALIDPGGPGTRPRVVLDAFASGPPILDDGPPASFSWLVWPGAAEPVLVFINRSTDSPVRLGTVALTELPDVPPGPPVIEPEGERRALAVVLNGTPALERFGGGDAGFPDAFARARNFAQYLSHVGATTAILPESLADRRRRPALDGQAAEDSTGADRLALLLRVLAKQGMSAWLELRLDGALPGLPAPTSPEALARGLVRVDARGQRDGDVYHPLHPDVRDALKRRVADAVAPWKKTGSMAGLLIRLGSGPTLLGGPDTGLDDVTFARFAKETFDFDPEVARNVPGLGTDDPRRFATRAQFLAGPGRAPWLAWRSRGIASLYAELADAARATLPSLTLAVVTPGLDEGPAGQEARRVDLAGFTPGHAWRAVGLDFDVWPDAHEGLIVLRGVGLSSDDLAHDLATSPELDAKVASRPRRGLAVHVEEPTIPEDARNLGTGLFLTATAPRDESAIDEALGHAMAAFDARWVVLSSASLIGHEEQVRSFAKVFRALPAAPAELAPTDRAAFGVAVRSFHGGSKTYLSLANETPYPIRLQTVLATPSTAPIDDLGRGLRLAPKAVGGESEVVLDVVPFGIAVLRMGSPQVRVTSVTPYPSEAVVASINAQYKELSGQLARLSQRPAGGPTAPANGGFEPEAARPVTLNISRTPVAPTGWRFAGGMMDNMEIDLAEFHSGSGSLRLNVAAPPASVVSEPFVPNVHSALTIQAWFRSDKPDTKLRLWIEGESGGQPFVRRSDLTLRPEWTSQAVRASGLPAGGLDTARIRFEVLSPGTVWLDDLAVTGATLSDPEWVNVRRALLAAMNAYREKRYADFARLASSHWARHPAVAADAAAADPAAAIRTGDASALPSDRRLR